MTTVDMEEVVKTTEKVKTKRPKRYHCILINDDFTPMEFVVMVLADIFHKNLDEATQIMFSVHEQGQGIAGTYSAEIAEEKRNETIGMAKAYGHPLVCKTQEAE